MIYIISLIFCYTLNGVLATDLHNENKSCDATATNLKNEVVNPTKYCTDKPCITKCCGENEILLYTEINNSATCVALSNELKHDLKGSNVALDYSDLKIYKSNPKIELEGSNKTFLVNFNLVRIKALMDGNCGSIWESQKPYLLDDGKFVIDIRNQNSERWYILDKYVYICIDRMVASNNDSTYNSTYTYFFMPVQDNIVDDTEDKIFYTGVATLISSFFLLLVLLVYCVLPQLRNLAGMILMVYVATLLVAFVTKAILNFIETNMSLCNVVYPIIYFLFQSSFLWLNIMSFDIWYTFRSIRLNRPLHRQGEVAKFLWYGLYAWGVAAAMTTAAVIIENSPLTDWPQIVKPGFSYCLTAPGALRYHYAPIAILTSVNIVLFLMTIYNIWLINKGLNDFTCSSNNKKNQMRFRLYVKMSLLMGISWVLEVLQALLTDTPVWMYALLNLYNGFIGVAIFFLFVFNMPTLVMLCKRFNIENKFVQQWKVNSSMRTTTYRPSNSKGSYSKTKTTDISVDGETCEVSFAKNPK